MVDATSARTVPVDAASPASEAVTTQCLSTPAAWQELRQDWCELWHCAPDATPFQHPEWLLSWWRHLGGGELAIATVRAAGTLVGLAPFFRFVEHGRGRLLPVGIGITDRLAPLLAPGWETHAAAAIVASLTDRARAGDSLEFHELPHDSPMLKVPAPPGWRAAISEESVSPALALPDTSEALAHCVPRKTLRDLRTARRRCRAAGHLVVEPADGSNCGALLEALFDLHAKRWRERGELGVLADPAVQAFHRAAVAGFAAAGLLRLYAMRLEGRIVAVFYGLAGRDRLHAYLTGFDPACERLSVGTVLLGHAIEEAVREGFACFDMLRGREAYKYAWGGIDQPSFCRSLSADPP